MNGKIQLLLVEDNPADTRLVQEMLRESTTATYELAHTDRLNTALQWLRTRHFDEVVLDLGLPDSQGIETLALTQQANPHLPIVVLTTRADESFATQVVRAGAQDYLVKGRFGAEALMQTIRYAIERKHAEEEIRRLNADLERRVAERTEQLASANRELESFAYSVSHDLRAPLRSVDGFSRIVLRDYHDQLDATGQEHLHRIREGTLQMSRLIDGLLELSHASRANFSRAPVDLASLARAALQTLQQAEPDRHVACTVPPSLPAKGDPTLLGAALHNLLANAWKFTGRVQDPRIELGDETRGNERIFWVRDNGAGFDMAYADRLFAPFQRLHSTEEFPGTGIGLATVQRIVHRHGGRIWAESAVNQGATFFFTLGETPEAP